MSLAKAQKDKKPTKTQRHKEKKIISRRDAETQKMKREKKLKLSFLSRNWVNYISQRR